MKNFSLTNRLIIALLSASLLIWSVNLITVYYVVHNESEEVLDQALVETAHAILSMHYTKDENAIFSPEIAESGHSNRIIFQIWNDKNQLLYQSNKSMSQALCSSDCNNSFHNTQINKVEYRVYGVWDIHHTRQIQIAEVGSVRSHILKEIGLHLSFVILLFIPLIAVVIFIIIKRSMLSLQKITNTIYQQSHEDIKVIHISQYPQEITPLIDAINHFLQKIGKLIDREKRFTADAAHELRTPLSIIKLNAQIIEHTDNLDDIKESARDIQKGIDRASRLTEQLLILSKLDSNKGTNSFNPINLAELIESCCDQVQPLLKAKHLRTRLDVCDLYISGIPEQIEILINNLLNNAIRYTYDNTAITIGCQKHDNHDLLFIEDEGPGIATEYTDLVFDRFFRVPGNQVTGSGLGLSIIKLIADQHQAIIHLTNGKISGLRVEIIFPRLK